jgi:hypothetical protein
VLFAKYNQNDQVKKDVVGRTGSTKWEGGKRNAYILLGKLEGKRLFGSPRRMWLDNIKIDLRVIGWGGKDWIDLDEDRGQ